MKIPDLLSTSPMTRYVEPPKPIGLASLPQPKFRLPLLGHLHLIKPLQAHAQFENWAKELGTPYHLQLGSLPVMVTDDAELSQTLSRQRPHEFTRGPRINPVFKELGIDGLFSAEAEQWEKMRRLYIQCFNATHLEHWFPQIRKTTQKLYNVLSQYAHAGADVDLNKIFKLYTVDVISQLAFGEDPDTLTHGPGLIQDHLARIFPAVMKRVMTPWSYWHHFRLPQDHQLEYSLSVVRRYAKEKIAMARLRLRSYGRGYSTYRNALEAMLAQEESLGLSEDEIVGNVLTLLLAGEDTTANTLGWTTLFLAQNPFLLEQAYVHVYRHMKDEEVCGSYEKLKSMNMMEHLALEALRLKPVVPFNGFSNLKETTVAGVRLPARSLIAFINRPAMLDEQNFGMADKLWPQRWGADRDTILPHNNRAFLQFGAGGRVCPGRGLAMMEIRLALSMIVNNFIVELVQPGQSVNEVNAFTMMPDRIPVRLKFRHYHSLPALSDVVASPTTAPLCPHRR